MKVNIWNTMGEIIHQFDSLEEAEEWIKDCEHEVLERIPKQDGDINIVVIESF